MAPPSNHWTCEQESARENRRGAQLELRTPVCPRPSATPSILPIPDLWLLPVHDLSHGLLGYTLGLTKCSYAWSIPILKLSIFGGHSSALQKYLLRDAVSLWGWTLHGCSAGLLAILQDSRGPGSLRHSLGGSILRGVSAGLSRRLAAAGILDFSGARHPRELCVSHCGAGIPGILRSMLSGMLQG